MIISSFTGLLTFLIAIVLVLALPVAVFWLLFKLVSGCCWLLWKGTRGVATGVGWTARGVGFSVAHVFEFVKNTILDTLRFTGALLTSVFVIPPILGNVLLGRWSAANHYGRAFERELKEAWIRLYRVAIGNPVRLLGLRALTEGVEERLPEVMAFAPGSDSPRGGEARFRGYVVRGSLPRGGSGARLYIAEPTAEKRDELARAKLICPSTVVIKAFFLEDGSTLPQIVRESRALTAAKELGLVLDHTLEQESFWYVMPFVPGSDLAEVTRSLHQRAGDEGLAESGLREVMAYAAQILGTLERFHTAGMWHKDIKPANVIVSSDGYAHLVDFGLVTPLRSAMTLTTHGTEFFRDPEMVRLAMQGVKVHEVDGVKFDLYSAGAVLYSMVENSFPAHGSLSQVSKRCPESLRWIVRRAMADTKNRYSSAREMLADLVAVMESADPFAVGPADLPSFRGDSTLVASLDPERFTPPSPTGFTPLPSEPLPKKSKPIRRRIHGAVLAASLLFFALLSFGALVTVGGVRDASAVHYVPQASQAMVVAETSETCYVHEDHIHHSEFCKGHTGSELARAMPERLLSGEPFDVLIVNDLPPTLETGVLEELENSLRDSQMVPHGLRLEDERELEWLAETRRVAGVAFPFDGEVEDRLERYLADNDVLDALYWLGTGPEGVLVHRIIAPPSEGEAPAHVADAVLR